MSTYFLIMWAIGTDPFIAGEYYDKARCEAAGAVQQVGLRHLVGGKRIHFKCELKGDGA